jgi:hypothetical protein
VVSASPEPLSAIPVELTAGAITEEPRAYGFACNSKAEVGTARAGNLLFAQAMNGTGETGSSSHRPLGYAPERPLCAIVS